MFAVPMLLLLGMQFVASLLSRGGGRGLFGTGGEMGWGLLVFLAVIGVVGTLANLVALGWFGLWMGLVSRNARMATLKTIVFVELLPWFAIALITGLGIPLMMFSVSGLRNSSGPSQTAMSVWLPVMVTALPAGLALVKNVLFWQFARRKLTRSFRDLAVRAVIPVQAVGRLPVIPIKP
jgi:hypothetical protein